MDRDTVRIILLVLGIIVIAGVYVWGRYKERLLDFLHRRGEFDELAYDEDEEETSRVDSEGKEHAVGGHEEAELLLPEEAEEENAAGLAPERASSHSGASRASALGAPFLIQLSVVAGEDGYFTGEELRDALVELDLIYGDMGIYHRYDREYRKPLFSVASLVEPGTFPIDDMENFECPGVVLFFQPPQVEDPLAVFDDLVDTCHELAEKLGGMEWDENHKPLTAEKIAQMRKRLEMAY